MTGSQVAMRQFHHHARARQSCPAIFPVFFTPHLGYFAYEENVEGDNLPIGIILSRYKDELLVEYATYRLNSQLFVQKYQLYLPDREELRSDLERSLLEARRGKDERG
jgi:hypothetical protein